MVHIALVCVFAAYLGFVNLVAAQNITTPRCSQSYYSWASNSLHQDPCLMAGYALAACSQGITTIPPLQTSISAYTGPQDSADDNNPCKCNSVSYSLISACAGCQGGLWSPYSAFVANCSSSLNDTTKGRWAPGIGIPVGTAFPAWAYDTLQSNTFNNATAYGISLQNTTEYTANNTSPTTASPMKSKSHTGAIAGGVVGGVVGLALIAGLVYFLIRRRRRKRAEGTLFETRSAPETRTVTSPTMTESTAPRRLYDPSDPSTFPDAMFSDRQGSSIGASSPGPGSTVNGGHRTIASWDSGVKSSTDKEHYRGLPEI